MLVDLRLLVSIESAEEKAKQNAMNSMKLTPLQSFLLLFVFFRSPLDISTCSSHSKPAF